MDIAKKHQMKIARSTLKMSIFGARIAGGMTHEQAYKFIFDTDLKTRLRELVAEYGDQPEWLSWELEIYGWHNPKELLDALGG